MSRIPGTTDLVPSIARPFWLSERLGKKREKVGTLCPLELFLLDLKTKY